MLQTVSQIKTVFAFVGENSAIKSFSECLDKQFSLSKGEALVKGVGTGMLCYCCCDEHSLWIRVRKDPVLQEKNMSIQSPHICNSRFL